MGYLHIYMSVLQCFSHLARLYVEFVQTQDHYSKASRNVASYKFITPCFIHTQLL